MIENHFPADWKALQKGVCQLFNEIGLTACVEKSITTPRGITTVDVYAIDENSIDKIQYIVECKNWSAAVPQSVVQTFTTIMHETGCNIGFIISQVGFQSGALQYAQSTNITCLTYQQLQERYWEVWWKRHFRVEVGNVADTLIQYVEPASPNRDRLVTELSHDKRMRYEDLRRKYFDFAMFMGMLIAGQFMPTVDITPPINIEECKAKIAEIYGDNFTFASQYYRDLKHEMIERLQSIIAEFNNIFGENIFANGPFSDWLQLIYPELRSDANNKISNIH